MTRVLGSLALAAAIGGGVTGVQAGAFHLAATGVKAFVANSGLAVTPSQDWNHLGRRMGRNAESWTMDGLTLNDVTFYGGVAANETLFKERSAKDKPLPRFNTTMLPPDVEQMFEESYRIANDTTIFHMDKIEPAKFLGVDGFRFFYTFTALDEVARQGVATAAIRDGKLYMITYEAPTIHYFDKSLGAYDKIVDSAVLGAKPAN